MATKVEQRKALIRYIGKEQKTGPMVKQFVMRNGWSAWQVSILLAQMVKDGHIRGVGPFADTPRATYRKSYGVTDDGLAWVDAHADWGQKTDEGVDTSMAEGLAMARPGKWTILPPGVGQRDVVLLRDRGFEVRRVIRWIGEGGDGEGQSSGGKR